MPIGAGRKNAVAAVDQFVPTNLLLEQQHDEILPDARGLVELVLLVQVVRGAGRAKFGYQLRRAVEVETFDP